MPRYPAVQLLDEQTARMTNAYRVFTDKHYPYFVTWTVVDWLPLFAEPVYRQILLDSLNYLRTVKRTQLNDLSLCPLTFMLCFGQMMELIFLM